MGSKPSVERLEDRTLLAYSFTKIASNLDGLANLGAAPALASDNAGTVAFLGQPPIGRISTCLYTGNGGTPRLLFCEGPDDKLDPYPSINNNDSVAFLVRRPQQQFIAAAEGDLIVLLYTTDNGLFVSFNSPSFNDSGTVAFRDMTAALSNPECIFNGNGGPVTTIECSGPFNVSFGKFPSLNNAFISAAPMTAYLKYSGYEQSINIGSGGPPRTLYSTTNSLFSSFGDPALNDLGKVAFFGVVNVGPALLQGIFAGNGGPVETIARVDGNFGGFDAHPSINNSGEVAFLATLQDGRSGIFTGSDPVNDKVIATGDTLVGATVTELHMFRQALNKAGEIAFLALTADGNSYIVRADPMGGSGGGGQEGGDGRDFAFLSEVTTGFVLQGATTGETTLRSVWQIPPEQAFPEFKEARAVTLWVRDAQDAYFAALQSRGHERDPLDQGNLFALDVLI
jgi:hypothetical protein